MIIRDLHIGRHQDGMKVCCKVISEGLPRDLCYFIRSTNLVSFTGPRDLDWALVGLIYVAMKLGRDILIDGKVSQSLYYFSNNALQDFMKVFDTSLKRISVTCSAFSDFPVERKGRVGTGFSSGVDSLYTLHSHSGKSVPCSYRVTDLFIFGVGGIGSRALFEGFWDRLKKFSTDNGYQGTSAWSNLPWFYSGIFNNSVDSGYEKTNSFRNCSAALVFSGYLVHPEQRILPAQAACSSI